MNFVFQYKDSNHNSTDIYLQIKYKEFVKKVLYNYFVSLYKISMFPNLEMIDRSANSFFN